MNTKQIEELTGISRQNIRYYERMGLLQPKREEENKYRDYSQEDVQRLKLIKMLRMLDMPVEEIGKIIHGETTLRKAVGTQKEELLTRQKQLQAAVDMCGKIEKNDRPQEMVNQYLNEMEYLQMRKGGFVQIYDDYRQVAQAAEQKQFTVYVPRQLYSGEEILRELELYGEEQGLTVISGKDKSSQTIQIEEVEYEVHPVPIRNSRERTPATAIVCTMCHPEKAADAKIPVRRKRIMQTVYEIFRNIRRQKKKSVLAIALCAVVVSFMALYLGNIDSNRRQFANLPNVYEITGRVQNTVGSYSSGLIIPEELSEAVKNSPYVNLYEETISLEGMYEEQKLTITGANCLSAVESLGNRDVQWMLGADNLSFFGKGGGVIASDMYLLSHDLEVGDEIQVDVNYFTMDEREPGILLKHPLRKVSLKIMGSARLLETDLICSLQDAKKWFEEEGVLYNAGSVAFRLGEPEDLNRFKKEMEKAGFQQISSTAKMSYEGKALVIGDLDYITSARSLRKSISFLSDFYPALLILILLMGYLVSYLLLQSRRLELAIMKSLGSGNLRITLHVFTEHMLLALAGGALGVLLNFMGGWCSGDTLIKIVGLFIICYGIGTMIPMGIIGKIGVMAVLAGKE